MSNKPTRGKGMKPKIKTISAEDLKKFLEKDGLLFTSQDLAKMLGVTEEPEKPIKSSEQQTDLYSQFESINIDDYTD